MPPSESGYTGKIAGCNVTVGVIRGIGIKVCRVFYTSEGIRSAYYLKIKVADSGKITAGNISAAERNILKGKTFGINDTLY